MNQERDSDETRGERARDDRVTAADEVTVAETERVAVVDERERFSERRRRIIVVSVLALLMALILVLIWRSRRTTTETTAEEEAVVVSVRVAKAEKQQIAAEVSALGTIFPRDQALVSAKISATIKQMAILKNRVVHVGDVIAVLESRDLQAQRNEAVAALNEARASARAVETGTIPQSNAQDQKALRDARAALTAARATYERRQALYQRGGISKKELEASQLELTKAENDLRFAEETLALRTRALNPNDRAQAQAKVNQAAQHLNALDAQLSYAIVRAPITGVVIDQALYEGSFVASGATIVTIADISQVIVKAPFSDAVAAGLKTGDPATIFPTDTPGEQMTGQVTLISRSVDPTSRAVEVWVTLANEAGRLRANGAAQVTVTTNTKAEAVIVPASAVTLEATNEDAGIVMVVDTASVAHETKVTVGIRTQERVEITSGLQGGETVVVEGNYALPDGTKVEVADAGDDQKPEGGDEEGDEP